MASTDDVALLELTGNRMRVWLGEDGHSLELLGRPPVSTTLAITDTGWSNTSTGGQVVSSPADELPPMTAATTSGVTVSASSTRHATFYPAWKAGDDSITTSWGSSGFTDSSSSAHTVNVNGAYISSAQSKFGGASGFFDGVDDHLTLDGSADFAFGTGDFVIDCWIRLSATNDESIYDGGTDSGGFGLLRVRSGTLRYHWNGANRINGTTALSTGTWYHVALVRSSGVTRLFLNGVQEGSNYADTNNYTISGTRPWIGLYTGGTLPFSGYIDELRVSKGTDRGWSAGFTPPSSPHTPDAQTVLLLHFDSSLPAWLKVDFGAGNTKAIASYAIRASSASSELDEAPNTWTLQCNDVDTGTGWTTVDSRSGQTGWAVSERRTFRRLDADTGTVEAFRYWRLNFTAGDPALEVIVSEIELFTGSSVGQVYLSGGRRVLNATAIGSLARIEKRVIVDDADVDVEHSLAINVSRGPVTLRVGSAAGDDDYIRETQLGTGYHNLAFTPSGDFHITLQSDALVDRIVQSMAIGDSGTVEIPTPWGTNDIANVRYDQSADVVYVDCADVAPYKIERRGTGRSWSVVKYEPNTGPFLSAASSSAKMSVNHFFGNVTIDADRPFFRPGHVGALIRMFHEGQSGQWRLGALDAKTDAVEMTGISDTGTKTANNERRIVVSASGTYTGRILVERSFDGPDLGFKPASVDYGAGSNGDTGTFTRTIDDEDDNVKVWYRARLSEWTSGVAVVNIAYHGGGITGVARITGYNANDSVSAEVLSRFSDTGPTDNWQESYWSQARGFPTAVALHNGRLAHAEGGNLFLSVADDYENFDDATEGDAGPIVRTLGSGPVDAIRFLISKVRLLIGTDGAELALTSSSLDEPVTPDNSSARVISTQGSANLRAVHMDTRAIHVQRSGKKVFMLGPSQNALGDYESFELTLLVPDLLEAGVVSISIQRQPDSRLHCVLADGRVAILTYEPQEEVICWTLWETDGFVEKAMVLPAAGEDAVFYHIRRTINGATRRFLEKWALESECEGDTGLTWLADCAASYTDTGRTTVLTDIAPHLAGASVVAWGSLDTGTTPHVDLSPDVNGVQTTYPVDTGGDVTLTGLTDGVHHAVVGLPYSATWKSTKLAYAAEAGTALAQMKRVDKIAFVLWKTHNNGLFYGNDTGHLNRLPRMHRGAPVDPDAIHETFDEVAMPFPGLWNTDSRVILKGKSPRPATVLGMVPTVTTNERV